MSYETNTIQTNALDRYTARASNKVIDAIESASDKSGVDFSYLIQQASAESSFNPNAEAKTSSATGLYQFIDSTWLSMIERYGDQYGLETDGMSKKELLNMRKDPEAASFMAAAFASENEKSLNNNWGGDVGSTELYFAHFMGAGGASSFLNARDENPMRPAADLFPREARANRNVFYDQKSGQPRTLEEVYQFFDKKFQVKDDASATSDIATAPTPPELPERKVAQNNNEIQDFIAYRKTNSIIMQRSQEMREATAQNGYGQISGFESLTARNIHNSLLTKSSVIARPNAAQSTPFFSLLAKPVDLMMLTQTMPSKVISDKV